MNPLISETDIYFDKSVDKKLWKIIGELISIIHYIDAFEILILNGGH